MDNEQPQVRLLTTPEELREQIISFAYGNLAIENPNVTKEMVEKVWEELYGK